MSGAYIKYVRFCSRCLRLSPATPDESKVEEVARAEGWVCISESEKYCPECRDTIVGAAARILEEEAALKKFESRSHA